MGGTLRAGLSDKATFVSNYPLKGTIIQLKNLVFYKEIVQLNFSWLQKINRKFNFDINSGSLLKSVYNDM